MMLAWTVMSWTTDNEAKKEQRGRKHGGEEGIEILRDRSG